MNTLTCGHPIPCDPSDSKSAGITHACIVCEANAQAAHWKQLALYLADCTAATAADEGHLKSLANYRRKRLFLIAWRALAAIRDGRDPHDGKLWRVIEPDAIVDRLERALARAPFREEELL